MVHPRPALSRPGRLALLLLAGAVAAGVACKSAAPLPPIEGVRSADQARPTLLASVSVAAIDKIVGDVDALSRTLGLPFTGKDLLTMLGAQHNLGPAAQEQIDTSKPVGVAFMAGPTKGSVLATVALAVRPGGTDKLIAALGAPAEKQRGATRIARPDGSSLWAVPSGQTLFTADSVEALAAGSALAAEAQRPPATDVAVTVYPDAFARWQGTDVRTAVASLRKELIDDQIAAAQRRGGPVPGPAERLLYETTIDLVLQPLGETASGAVTLDIDPAKGVRFGVGLQPRSGSTFARQIAAPTPYVVDPSLFAVGGGAPVAVVWAVGPSAFWLDLYQKALAAQAKAGVRGAGDVGQGLAALTPSLTGAMSGTLRAQKGGLSSEFVAGLKGGSPAILDGLAALAMSRGFTELMGEIYGKASPQVSVRRDRETLRSDLAFPVRERPGDVGTILKAVLGSATVSTVMTVSGGRMLGATEPGAIGRLAAMTGAPATTKPAIPALATALDETRGQDAFLYLDLWAMVKPLINSSTLPMGAGEAQMLNMITGMPGFAGLQLPLVMSYRGGKALDAELRVPLSTLTAASNVIRPFIGAGGGLP